jgi:transposase
VGHYYTRTCEGWQNSCQNTPAFGHPTLAVPLGRDRQVLERLSRVETGPPRLFRTGDHTRNLPSELLFWMICGRQQSSAVDFPALPFSGLHSHDLILTIFNTDVPYERSTQAPRFVKDSSVRLTHNRNGIQCSTSLHGAVPCI